MFALTMKKATIGTLIFFIFASQHIFAKLTILRGSSNKDPERVKLICLSEDDGGALVWNLSLNLTDYDKIDNFRFRGVNEFNNNEINCKMNANKGCLESWNRENWNLTNSLKTPMGPVSDQRWEEFKQDVFRRHDHYRVDFNFTANVKLPFSIRTSSDVDILLCNGSPDDFCYRILIGGWTKERSSILKCESDVSLSGNWTERSLNCSKPVDLYQHTLLPMMAREWRTFVITWSSVKREINVHDTDGIFLTYTEEEEFLHSGKGYHMFIINHGPMLFRFHIYDFLHTTVESAILTSPIFQFNNDVICVQLLIGLCAKCDAHVVLLDAVDNEVLEQITVKGLSANHDLPMWQSVKIKSNSINHTNYSMKIQLIPELNDKENLNPLWAIANVRQCPQNGALRKGEMLAVRDWDSQTDYHLWSHVTCQKLFYDEHAVVSYTSRAKLDLNLDDANCSEGKIGPQCLFSCQDDLNGANDCKGSKICYVNGCTCASGFIGDSCTKPCGSSTYGYNCKKTCGSCLYSISKEQCNKVTGACSNGCNNTKEVVYVPPLCQTSVDKPDAPTIISTNETTIYAAVSIAWKDEYEKIPILYSFIISGHIKYSQPSWKELFRNMTQLTERFDNLVPGATYRVGFNLNVVDVKISSDWQVAETKCNSVKNFDITPQEDGMIIDWRLTLNQLHSCPTSWYNLEVRNIDTNKVVVFQVATLFPYKLQGLPSYTPFDVIIRHKDKKLFSMEIRTLEGIPSSVSELQHILSANTLTLIWRPPREPNGEIVRYDVYLKVEKYHGCKNVRPTLNKHIIIKFTTEPTIVISDLLPYSLYSAQVRAHNSRYFSMVAETIVNTTQSEIPSEVFSNLTLEDWKLSWSPPEDCTTITGSLKTRIKIHGISDAVKHINTKPISTQRMSFDLLDPKLDPKLKGAERYVVRIYVIRDYNSKENVSACKEYEFETPPTAPPRVINLEVVEVDTRQIPVVIHLRWQSPRPPLNGKLQYYGIQLCDNEDAKMNCSVTEVQLNESCDLWDNYICKVVQSPEKSLRGSLEIFAYNMNVTDPGPSVHVTDLMILNETPDEPRNITYTINNHSVVDLNWLHPWKTGDHLGSFRINIEVISSNLREPIPPPLMNAPLEYLVTQYKPNYSKRLYLFPSTRYIIKIQAVTVANKFSNPKIEKIHTPSNITFGGVLETMVDKSDSTILLNIPHALNDTRDSMMYIIVKSPILCEDSLEVPGELRARANIKINEDAWLAAKDSSSKFAGNQFRFGDKKIDGDARNCPLKSEESYEIVIIVTEGNSSKDLIMLAHSIPIDGPIRKHYVAGLISIISFFVLTSAACYLYQSRKRQRWIARLIQAEMAFPRDMEIYEVEMNPVILNIKQDLLNLSRHSLSQTISPETSNAIRHDDEEEEIQSLVEMKDFEDYVRQAIQSGLLDKQYKTFPKGQIRSWYYGKLPQNKYKNRYENLIAYDETRVILKTLPGDVHNDYINANYITGCGTEKRYIATQGPKPSTIVDFWRMIWHENVLIICMLANVVENGKTICEQYWPDIGKKKKYGDIIVFNAKHNVFADYCFRTFHVTCGEETRKIEHLHYTAWPDHGIPLYTHSIVTYLKKLLATSSGDGPVVVHCSAGTGRTGTIILCDVCLRRAATEQSINVFAEMTSIATKRPNLMDNEQQYLLAHLVIVEYLFFISSTLCCNDLLMTQIKKLLPVQQQRLQNIEWQDEALRQGTSLLPLSERNRAKNRFPDLILDNINRIYLKRYPASDEDSDYISGAYVDGVKLRNQYLATQLPMPSTNNDFWRMVAEFKVGLILMLQPPDLQDPTCCAIAPASGKFNPIPYLNITLKEVVEMEHYTSQKLLVVDNSEKPSRKQSVTILRLTEWKPGKDQPPPPVMMMITFWQAAEKIARGDGPIVTLCHDGVTGCGLYLSMSFLLERMAIEKECDVYLAVRVVRRSRPDFLRSLTCVKEGSSLIVFNNYKNPPMLREAATSKIIEAATKKERLY